jgi:hypothetical protein
VSKQPEDVICATKYLSHLRDQPHKIPNIPRHRVTALLVNALAVQVKLEAGKVMQNIREMAVLCRELFTLETSDVDTTHLIILTYRVVISKIRSGVPDQPLDELIEFSRVARKRRPDLLEAHMTFAISLVFRYAMTSVNDDYEEAASTLDDVIAYSYPGNGQDESVAIGAIGLVTGLARLRSMFYQTPEHLEEAIYRSRTCASSSSFNEHLPGPMAAMDPEVTANDRFGYFGSIEGVEESFDNRRGNMLSQEYKQTIDRMQDLVFGIRNTDDTTEIDEAIEEGRSIVLASSPTNTILGLFGQMLFEAFDRTKKIQYLNESINVHRQQIEPPLPQARRFLRLPDLSWSLLVRSLLFPGHRTQDLDEAMELSSQYVSSAQASLLDRF